MLSTLDTGDDRIFSGEELEKISKGLASTRLDFGQEMISGDSGNFRELFVDLSLAELGRSAWISWSGSTKSLAKFFASTPLLVEHRMAENWRSHPDIESVEASFGGVDLALVGRTLTVEVAKRDLRLCCLRPKFPEWYVFVKNESGPQQQKRREILNDIQEHFLGILVPAARLPEEKIPQLFALFMTEAVPVIMDHSDIRKIFAATYAMLASMCDCRLEDDFFDTARHLPLRYKEFMLVVMNNNMRPKMIPQLMQMLDR